MLAANVNFTSSTKTATVTADGQLMIGAGSGQAIRIGTLGSTDGSITWTVGPGTITGQVTGGASVGKTITGTTGGALSPTGGNWNILAGTGAAGTTPIQTNGAASTLTINVQRSQAIASADSTKVGLANFNSADFTVDADGFVSIIGGAAVTTVNVQRVTATGAYTYTPTSGMKYVIVELVGGGGGGGGSAAAGAGNDAVGGGGGSGAYAKFLLTAAQVGASKSGSIGTGGAGGVGGASGTNGGNTTLVTASTWTASGGIGGSTSGAGVTATAAGGASGTVTAGTGTQIEENGADGGSGGAVTIYGLSGAGGANPLGLGGMPSPIVVATATNGNGGGRGGGGSGSVTLGNTASTGTGGAGGNGMAIFTEFI